MGYSQTMGRAVPSCEMDFIRWIAVWTAFLMLSALILNSSIALGETNGFDLENPHKTIHPEAEVRKILLVLENKIGDQKLLERAKDKLAALSERQTRLLASIADRIDSNAQTSGADIGFLIMTVLIILS